jgi:hypothetical protein
MKQSTQPEGIIIVRVKNIALYNTCSYSCNTHHRLEYYNLI